MTELASNLVPDVLEPGLSVVFCGTAPSAASFERLAYYAKPGNRFWPTLHAVGLTPRQLVPEEFRSVTEFGIGLTDLCKHVYGQDASLVGTDFDPDALREKIVHHAPEILALTSKTAAQHLLGHPVAYGFQDETIGDTRLFVLPSTSGLATRYWDESFWQQLASRLRCES